MVVILNNSSFQFSKVHAQFQGYCICMAIVNSYEKKIIYDFGNDFCFQNQELSL